MSNTVSPEVPNPGLLADGNLMLEVAGVTPHPVHRVVTYFFRMLHKERREEIGSINLRAETNPHIEMYAGHVGYCVQPGHQGHRYAARSVRLLIPFAGKLGINPIWITCDPENMASRRSCELAGAEFVEIVNVPKSCIIHRSGHTRKCRYRLDLFDPAGHPIDS